MRGGIAGKSGAVERRGDSLIAACCRRPRAGEVRARKDKRTRVVTLYLDVQRRPPRNRASIVRWFRCRVGISVVLVVLQCRRRQSSVDCLAGSGSDDEGQASLDNKPVQSPATVDHAPTNRAPAISPDHNP